MRLDDHVFEKLGPTLTCQNEIRHEREVPTALISLFPLEEEWEINFKLACVVNSIETK